MQDETSKAAIMEFARTENIAAFTRQLKVETDPVRRALLARLIEEQKALAANPASPGAN